MKITAADGLNYYGLDANGDGAPDDMETDKSPGASPDLINTCVGTDLQVVSSSNPKTPCQDANNDVTVQRVVDYKPDFYDEGLLKTLDRRDVLKTDVFVFRLSNGQLLVGEVGLRKDDVIKHGDPGSHDSDGNQLYLAHLHLALPGGYAYPNSVQLQYFQDVYGMSKDVSGIKVDRVRPGEPIEIVAINRPTGYIGTKRTTFKVDDKGNPDVPLVDINMMPPNLKVQVVRTSSSNATHTVGYRGAATMNDSSVVLKTAWLDHDGKPLPTCPVTSPGSSASDCGFSMTGRLAVVNSSLTVSGVTDDSNDIVNFAIRPGTYMQVIKLKPDLQAKRYYLQVSGRSAALEYDDSVFATPGDNDAPLPVFKQRPADYVPVRVPVFDEQRYNELRTAAAQGGEDIAQIPEAYQWPYRPEMTFSVVNVTPKKLIVSYHWDVNSTPPDKEIDLTSSQDISSVLDDNVVYATLLYGLDGPTNSQDISVFGAADEQYVFAIGGDEQLAAIGGASDPDKAPRFDSLDSLNQVQGSDLLALSLYLNSDPSNVLYDVSLNGLYAYYEAPTPLHRVKSDKDLSTDTKKAFRTLGGMRLMLYYRPKEGDVIKKYDWDVHPKVMNDSAVKGQWYPDFGAKSKAIAVDKAGIPLDGKRQMYWQPDKWALSTESTTDIAANQYDGTLTLTYANGNTEKKYFEIDRRTLEPEDNPMKGSDVQMLEDVLWHMGMTPGVKPGYLGQRLAENERDEYRKTKLTFKKNEKGKIVVKDEGSASLAIMVGRFDYISFWPLQTPSSKEDMKQYGADKESVLDELGRHWQHYWEAYDTWDGKATITLDNLATADLTNAANVFDGTIDYRPVGGAYYYDGTIAKTYTETVHGTVKNITGASFERYDILKAISELESFGEEQRNLQTMLSAAGETGSKGLNQIRNNVTYGGKALDGDGVDSSSVCSGVSAYDKTHKSQVNHYDAHQSLLAMAEFLSASSANCGRSFNWAFAKKKYTGTYSISADHNLIGYYFVHGSTATDPTVKTAYTSDGKNIAFVSGGKHVDDDYELLEKGIGAYNQGVKTFNVKSSWVGFLVANQSLLKDRVKTAMSYALKIMDNKRLGLGYREYVWKGGVFPALNWDGSNNPNAGKTWCFAFGEKEWVSGEFFKDVKLAALMYANSAPLKKKYSDPGVMVCE